jgi:indolepyruvate ferredoxin oxidoreductase alpha subunit
MTSIIAEDAVDKRVLLMGNEAIARGAVEAGVEVMAAYPGTPSSEIGEVLAEIADEEGFYVEWSTNEKVAFEVAAGASMVGARSMVAMKNAGLNVSMDTFMTLPYTGIKGSMVVVVADDPNAHYSSTEQDTRIAAKYAEILCFEPMDQQEAKDMTKEAFLLSEKLSLPVFLRSVTRISHASGDVTLGSICRSKSKLGFNKHWKLPYRWAVYGPPSVASRHVWLHEQLPAVRAESEKSPFNRLFYVGNEGSVKEWNSEKPKARLAVIASGLGACYALEAIGRLGLEYEVPFLKIGTPFPLPAEKICTLLKSAENVLIVEEGDPLVEEQAKALVGEAGLNVRIMGKTAGVHHAGCDGAIASCGVKAAVEPGVLPPYGEINSDKVFSAIRKILEATDKVHDAKEDAGQKVREGLKDLVAPRSSTLCAGCPHLGSFFALREALRRDKGVHIINGDIGCYEQGGYGIFSREVKGNDSDSKRYRISSPYEILDTTHVMGSGIGLAMGQAQAGYSDGKIVAVAGDSTFFHATLPALVNAVYTKANITFLVLDNSWTCMTGHQPSPTTGQDATGKDTASVSIEQVVRSVGINSIETVDAYNIAQAKEAIEAALEYEGPAVVVLRRECALQVQRRTRRRGPATTYVDKDECTGCRICVELGCPAVTYDSEARKAGIDEILCVDCGLCPQVCPQDAIIGSVETACNVNQASSGCRR